MSIPMKPDDPCYHMLLSGPITTPVIYREGCYICEDLEFSQMGLPLCTKCLACDGHVAADHDVCDDCSYSAFPFHTDELPTSHAPIGKCAVDGPGFLFAGNMGVYLGSCMGLSFWSNLDAVGQTEALIFAGRRKAGKFIRSWCGVPPSERWNLISVKPEELAKGYIHKRNIALVYWEGKA